MEPVLEIARQHGLFVVEDAAQAHGAEYRGRRVGGLGDAGVFSFFGNKVITTGEGGMVTVRSPELFDKLRFLRNQGMDPHRRYWFPVIGYNYRITNLQAAVGVAQLERIDARLRERRRLAQWYQTHLAPLNDFLILPVEEAWARHTFWLYSVVLREATAAQRDSVLSLLEQEGIETRPIFYPMHLLPPYRTEHQPCPTAESIALRGLSLPTHSGVTEEDVLFIAQAFHRLRNRSTILSKHRSL
jgi:perosamine synthetase